jgi:tetratricopeptide (TPR) repeat protein
MVTASKDRDMQTDPPAPQPEDAETLLRVGIAAVKSGQRERARDMLMRVVEQDEENVLAWLWLSGVVDSLDDREVCLENVLALDPDNGAARKGLALVHQQKVDGLLRKGIAAAKSGQRERARDLLTRVVDQDDGNISAWLWLSGVVDSLDDREVCLENVLALDPDNDAARRGLAIVRKQRGAQAPSPEEVDAYSPTVPEPGLLSSSPVAEVDTYSPLVPEPGLSSSSSIAEVGTYSPAVPGPGLPPSSSTAEAATYPTATPEPGPLPWTQVHPPYPSAEFDDEYLCPYCAAPTEPKDRRCKACDGKLWIKFRKQERRSKWLWIALLLQAINTIQSAVLPLILSLIVFEFGGSELSAMVSEIVDVYVELLGVSGATIEMWTRFAFFAALLIFLFSLAVLIALYLRWKPAYYLFLINAALGLFWAIANIILSFSPTPDLALLGGGFVCGGVSVLIAAARLWMVFQMQDDFAFDRRRILLRLDTDVTSVPMILARGHEYASRKMWALAAIHMRRAVGSTPDRMDGRIALTLTYLRLKRYDLATQALAEAKRISPDDPHVKELQTLLDDLHSASNSSRRA